MGKHLCVGQCLSAFSFKATCFFFKYAGRKNVSIRHVQEKTGGKCIFPDHWYHQCRILALWQKSVIYLFDLDDLPPPSSHLLCLLSAFILLLFCLWFLLQTWTGRRGIINIFRFCCEDYLHPVCFMVDTFVNSDFNWASGQPVQRTHSWSFFTLFFLHMIYFNPCSFIYFLSFCLCL